MDGSVVSAILWLRRAVWGWKWVHLRRLWKRGEIDRLREEVRAAGLAESIQRDLREALDAEMARLRLEWTKASDERKEALCKVCPFGFDREIYLRDVCRKPPDKLRSYPPALPV
jgi:hypothetical protein